MRKLLALLCAAAFFSFQAAYLEGQGRGAADDPWSRMDSAFNSAESEFTQADAYYLGRAVAANILAAYRPYNQNQELTRYLNRICQTLVINSSQPVAFNGYHVIILDSAEFNAFASPGGHIFVTKRLVEAAASEDMLAAVIAHELAHIMLRHSISIIDDMKIAGEASAAAGQAQALSGRNANNDRLMQFRNSVSQAVDTMMKNGYSQTQEFAADREALALLANAGYNPAALTEVLQVLQRVQASQRGGFNTTHPSPAERVASISRTNVRARQDTSTARAPRFKKLFP